MWLTLKEVCAELSMRKRTFLQNVRNGILPRGVIRPGEKSQRWTDEDVRQMNYRLTFDHKFSGELSVTENRQMVGPASEYAGRGKVYFISGGDIIKIGYTSGDPEDRMAQLQSGSPAKLFIMATMPGDMKREKLMHRRFKDLRAHGE